MSLENCAVDKDTDRDLEEQESDKESNICEGYYGSDRSDILDESEGSFGSDVDFENYVTSNNQDLNGDSSDKWSKIKPSDGNLKITSRPSCTEESNLTNNLPQLKNCPPRNSPPDSYFGLFFTSDVWDLFTNETNKFANTPNHLNNWVDVSVVEMKKYFALILHMGLTRTLHTTEFWKEKSSMFLSYPTIMSLDRFKIISSKLHMSSQQPQTDMTSDYISWTRVRPLLKVLNSSFMNFYIPAQDVTVDESVYGISPKYKSVFVSYTPKHHVEFGLKKYDLCDSSTGYTLQSTVLSKADFTGNHINPFMQKAIFSLISDADLLNKCHHLFILNAYPKLSLVKTLLEKQVYVTANVNKKTKELPKQIVQAKLNAGDTLLFESEKLNTFIVAFKNKNKSRYIVTSLLDDPEKIKERKSRKTTSNFTECNPYYDAVDYWYKEIYDITCTRCTSKYWRKLLYNLIDVTVLNSYILYTLNTDKPISKQKFVSRIVCGLVGNLPEPQDTESEDDDFEESESSGLSDFLMSDSDSKSDMEFEEDD